MQYNKSQKIKIIKVLMNPNFFVEFLYCCCCSAGIGVLNAARKTMARMLGNNESAFDSALRQFWVVDANVSHTKHPKMKFAL